MAKKKPAVAKIPKTVDEYIAGFDKDRQKVLNKIRKLVKTEAPEATEKISYGMPAFFLKKNLLYFAAFEDHYSIFPSPRGIDELAEETAPYRSGKGTLRFDYDKPIPWELIKKVVRFRVREIG